MKWDGLNIIPTKAHQCHAGKLLRVMNSCQYCLGSLCRILLTSARGQLEKDQFVRHLSQKARAASGSTNQPPVPPTNCCGKGCPKCVWLRYAEELTSYYQDTDKASEDVLSRIEDPVMKTFLQLELKESKK